MGIKERVADGRRGGPQWRALLPKLHRRHRRLCRLRELACLSPSSDRSRRLVRLGDSGIIAAMDMVAATAVIPRMLLIIVLSPTQAKYLATWRTSSDPWIRGMSVRHTKN